MSATSQQACVCLLEDVGQFTEHLAPGNGPGKHPTSHRRTGLMGNFLAPQSMNVLLLNLMLLQILSSPDTVASATFLVTSSRVQAWHECH